MATYGSSHERVICSWVIVCEVSKLDTAFLLTIGSFLLPVELFCLQLTTLAFLLTVGAFALTVLAFFTCSWSFFAYSGKVRLISALKDCKQRSLTVSKKAPTASQKASPVKIGVTHVMMESPILRRLANVQKPFFTRGFCGQIIGK